MTVNIWSRRTWIPVCVVVGLVAGTANAVTRGAIDQAQLERVLRFGLSDITDRRFQDRADTRAEEAALENDGGLQ